MPEPIHIVCAADAKYGSYTGIMLSSVLRANPNEIFEVHLLSDNVRKRDSELLRRMLMRNGSKLSLYEVSKKLDEHIQTMKAISYVSRTTYARLFIDRYLPSSVKHIVYLDGDIVCRGSLQPLWSTAISCPLIAAIPNKSESNVLDEAKSRLGMPPEATYFNMGVMALNLENWRTMTAGEQALKYLDANLKKIKWGEQDVINTVFWNKISPLPETLNLQLGAYPAEKAAKRIEQSVLIHYTGTYKPWQIGYSGAGGSLFRKAKAQSPWRLMLPESRMVSRLKKSLRKKLRA